jgi:hypothetical protein
MLLKEGIGWGYMPEHRVPEDVEKGAARRLDKPEPTRGSERSYAIYRTDPPPGPTGSWLISRLQAQAAGAPKAINQRSILTALRHLWKDQGARNSGSSAALTPRRPKIWVLCWPSLGAAVPTRTLADLDRDTNVRHIA